MEKIKLLKTFIVDDDPFCAGLYEQHLTNNGFKNVSCFYNGQDCINNLTEQPAIIFLDHSMVPLNGLEVLKKIKRFNPDIYTVLVSGQEDMQVAISALKYGAFDYIIKGDKDLEMMDVVLQKITNVMDMLKQKPSKRWSSLKLFMNF